MTPDAPPSRGIQPRTGASNTSPSPSATGSPASRGLPSPKLSWSRPSLLRQQASPPGEISPSAGDARYKEGAEKENDERNAGSAAGNTTDEETVSSGDDGGGSQEQQGGRSPDEIELERLKKAMNAKLLLSQQRARLGNRSPVNPATLGARRISPIKEEAPEGMSPSLEAAFSSPLPTSQSSSTVSTESSSRTIRGSVPATPNQTALRTPSYPFPYVAGNPRTWSSSFHQPFTALSPTATAIHGTEQTISDRLASGGSTPLSTGTFMPALGSPRGEPEDPRYPTPKFDDVLLTLSSEPGLEAWWANVAKIMQTWFAAERATLAVPADATDIENVPWGQKATFNSAQGTEQQAVNRHASVVWRPESSNKQDRPGSPEDTRTTHTLAEHVQSSTRPPLTTRHSVAGYERKRADILDTAKPAAAPIRPQGLLRTVSHAPGPPSRPEHPLRQVSSAQLDGGPFARRPRFVESSFSDLDFSSIGGDGQGEGPVTNIFATLRALNHEPNALIDNGGINRILERGKLVTLTRDYSNASASSKSPESQTNMKSRAGHARLNGPGRATAAPEPKKSNLTVQYEEYEQFPASPWAQSPAPSPAIQTDSAENPFFAGTNVDEASFDPSSSPQDYSKFAQVEAIGVDKASTITHIPLIHPVLSQVMRSADSGSPAPTTPSEFQWGKNDFTAASVMSDKPNVQRRAPIAILSVLSSTVPFPQNLTKSLKRIGPHLATSFYNAQQFSAAQNQVTTIRHRRLGSGSNAMLGPITTDPESLDDLVGYGFDEFGGSTTGSITSPSDYSGRSKHSPGGSLAGTPGWDPAYHGYSSRAQGTTSSHMQGSDAIDSYFDAKKRVGFHKSETSSASHAISTASKTPSKEQPAATRRSFASPEDDDPVTPKSEQKQRVRYGGSDDKTASGAQQRDTSPSRNKQIISPRNSASRPNTWAPPEQDDRRHSLLHSYGADFSASFQSLPAAAALKSPRTPGLTQTPSRASSSESSSDMPPPSERLLRTIIDSLPVQIFTASVGTGKMTWVNSKFLVYRGQDSRQVLQDPWKAIHPDDREEYLAKWAKSLRTGQQLQHKVRLLRFDGNYRWFYVRAAPLKDRRQQIVHWMGTNMDVHEQHIAEVNSARQLETAASEAKYRALANSSPQIVFTVTQQRGVTFCNSQWLSFSGQTEQQAAGLGFTDYVHPEDLVKCRLPEFDADGSTATNVPTSLPPEPRRQPSSASSRKFSSDSSDSSSEGRTITSPGSAAPSATGMPQRKLSKLADTGILKVTRDADGRPSYSTEVRLRSKDGVYRWHLVRVLLAEEVLEENGEQTWYGTCTDINDHKELEAQLKETMDAKSRFLSNMSHEIRTPLNGITGMVNFLIDSNMTAEQMEHVNIIRNSTEGLRDLINDILDLSKVEAGMIKLSYEWFRVRNLIEDVNDLTSAMAMQKKLELNYIVDANVPLQVKGDKVRIRQVLLNVIGNAIKFTKDGEVFVGCSVLEDKSVEVTPKELMLQFEVIDTGRGFTEKEAEFLFKRFSQIDASSTRQHGGTGLGLAISMQLVELHGGKMKATSEPGKGSTFTFTIKFQKPTAEDQPPPDDAAASDITAPLLTPAIPKETSPGQSLSSIQASEETTPVPLVRPTAEVSQRLVQSPSAMTPPWSQSSPAASSGSSDPSLRAYRTSSNHSARSSASSFIPDVHLPTGSSMTLSLPKDAAVGRSRLSSVNSADEDSVPSEDALKATSRDSLTPTATLMPPMYSVLVASPLIHTREATVSHIIMTLPKTVAQQVTAREGLEDCRSLLAGDEAVIFTHVVLVLRQAEEVLDFLNIIFRPNAASTTSVIVICDLEQKQRIIELAPDLSRGPLAESNRLRFIFKPLKPSKLAVIFDPQRERETSTDRSHESAQQIAVKQKNIYADLTQRFSGKQIRVLLVEDNPVNQMVNQVEYAPHIYIDKKQVIMKFLAKIAVQYEKVDDGVQCTDKVFANPHGHYSIILVNTFCMHTGYLC